MQILMPMLSYRLVYVSILICLSHGFSVRLLIPKKPIVQCFVDVCALFVRVCVFCKQNQKQRL